MADQLGEPMLAGEALPLPVAETGAKAPSISAARCGSGTSSSASSCWPSW